MSCEISLTWKAVVRATKVAPAPMARSTVLKARSMLLYGAVVATIPRPESGEYWPPVMP